MAKDLVVLRIDAFEKGTLTGQRYIIAPALNAFSLGRTVLAKGERIGTLTPLRELLNDDGDVTILAQSEAVALLPAVQALVEALQATRLRIVDLPSADYDDASMLQLLLAKINRALAPFEDKKNV